MLLTFLLTKHSRRMSSPVELLFQPESLASTLIKLSLLFFFCCQSSRYYISTRCSILFYATMMYTISGPVGLLHCIDYLKVLSPALVIITLICLTFLFTSIRAKLATRNAGNGQKPPIAPYWIPFFAHFVLFLFGLDSLLTKIAEYSGNSYPIRMVLGTQEYIFLTGPQNVKLIWKNSQWLTAKAGRLIGLRIILDTPAHSLGFYRADTSGNEKKPLPGSNVPPEHRVWHLTRQPIMDCLSGNALTIFTENFQDGMIKRIQQYTFNEEWTELPDLFFLEQCPNFVNDFWQFHHAIIHLKNALPKWMTPESCKARKVCLQAVEKWHDALRIHDPDMLLDTGKFQDARFGNELMRSRRRIMAEIERMDKQTAASADLGLLWALNANHAVATFWLLLEIIQDPSLHPTIHREIAASTKSSAQPDSHVPLNNTPSSPPSLNMPILGSRPLLQSMHAETLRLRTAALMIQSAEFGDFNFNGWLFPKDKLIFISSRSAHMDRESWSRSRAAAAGTKTTKPVEKFDAERFLTWKAEAEEDPISKDNNDNNTKHSSPNIHSPERGDENDNTRSKHLKGATFSLTGHAGKWIPYGGGPGIRPGRHFAKNMMLLTTALMFSTFEIELVEGKKPRMDLRYYGVGVLPPGEKVPCRIRRRGKRAC